MLAEVRRSLNSLGGKKSLFVYIFLQLIFICRVRFIHRYQKSHCHRKEHSLALCGSVLKDLYRWQEM